MIFIFTLGDACILVGQASPAPQTSSGQVTQASPAEPNPIGDVQASDAIVKGSVTMAGSGISLMSGASITSVKGAATLHLRRGGEVRVCAPTTLTITASKNERELLMSMNVGAMEANYTRAAGADSIVTPDFRLLLAGPGTFHLAISADIRGNTCLRTLPGNLSSVIVSELSGEGVYQLKPEELVVFHEGRMTEASTQAPAGCGCAAPAVSAPAISAPRPASPPASTIPANGSGAVTGTGLEANAGATPMSRPGETHVEVDVPFVFRGTAPSPTAPPRISSVAPGSAQGNRGAPAKLMSSGALKPVPCELLSPLLPTWECRAMVALNHPPAALSRPGPSSAAAKPIPAKAAASLPGHKSTVQLSKSKAADSAGRRRQLRNPKKKAAAAAASPAKSKKTIPKPLKTP